MEKKDYEQVWLEIIRFENEDVITYSCTEDDCPEDKPCQWDAGV